MRVGDLYSLVTTTEVTAARDFNVRHFGFTVSFEASWYVYLEGGADVDSRGAAIAFMHPNHPSPPPGPERFDGKGIVLTLELADVESVYKARRQGGAPFIYPLTDEIWEQNPAPSH